MRLQLVMFLPHWLGMLMQVHSYQFFLYLRYVVTVIVEAYFSLRLGILCWEYCLLFFQLVRGEDFQYGDIVMLWLSWCLCLLYADLRSVWDSAFWDMYISSVVLLICKVSLVLYSAGSGVKNAKVVVSWVEYKIVLRCLCWAPVLTCKLCVSWGCVLRSLVSLRSNEW